MKSKSLRYVLFFLFALSSNISAELNENSYMLIDASSLSRQHDEAGLIIIDTRSPKHYQQGHIDGAINIPVDSTFDSNSRIGLLAPVSEIQRIFSQAGVGNSDRLVIYDSGRLIDAARLFWIFEVFGQQQLAILDAGYKGWKNRGYPVSRTPHRLPPTNFIPAIKSDRLATTFSTRLAMEDPDKVLIDARPSDDYLGLTSKAPRFGHIPSAVNIPASRLFQEQDNEQQLRPLNELQDLYRDIDPDSRVITYCNKGKEAALTYFVLRNLGYDVAAYDGSWVEWGNNQALPIIEPTEQDQ